jgi:hypothetical protein
MVCAEYCHTKLSCDEFAVRRRHAANGSKAVENPRDADGPP